MNIGLIDVDKTRFLDEVWKPAKGFEKYIEVSNLGRVRTFERTYVDSRGRTCRIRQHISKTYVMKNGYEVATIYLFDMGIKKKELVHRLVSTTFIPNPSELPQVNHRDENKLNNSVSNLEWCDAKYNLAYGTKREREAKTKSKPVKQLTLDGALVRVWESAAVAAKFLGVDFSSISAVCCHKPHCYTYKGFKWEFA